MNIPLLKHRLSEFEGYAKIESDIIAIATEQITIGEPIEKVLKSVFFEGYKNGQIQEEIRNKLKNEYNEKVCGKPII